MYPTIVVGGYVIRNGDDDSISNASSDTSIMEIVHEWAVWVSFLSSLSLLL